VSGPTLHKTTPPARKESKVRSLQGSQGEPLRRVLADPKVSVVVVDHRDRRPRMNAEPVEAALSVHGRRLA